MAPSWSELLGVIFLHQRCLADRIYFAALSSLRAPMAPSWSELLGVVFLHLRCLTDRVYFAATCRPGPHAAASAAPVAPPPPIRRRALLRQPPLRLLSGSHMVVPCRYRPSRREWCEGAAPARPGETCAKGRRRRERPRLASGGWIWRGSSWIWCGIRSARGEQDGEAPALGKKSERRGRYAERYREERKKENLLDEVFTIDYPNLPSQIDLPRLLELL
ncbi:hypothetical protein C2845_PM04G10660 [Panicum miliaceum]|uniref:Uncharacterized protein n=1 Tax=Panicum miliaceum TaxID=4540 RepID=A0A3L6QMF1_PANMI|nr:hypothetical protein C2845_PM04G10660 [Panicum miliaceum]